METVNRNELEAIITQVIRDLSKREPRYDPPPDMRLKSWYDLFYWMGRDPSPQPSPQLTTDG